MAQAELAYQVAVEEHAAALVTADDLLAAGVRRAKVLWLKAQSLQRVGDYTQAGTVLRQAAGLVEAEREQGRAAERHPAGPVVTALLRDNDAVLRPEHWRAAPDGLIHAATPGDGEGSLVAALMNARCAARRGDWHAYDQAMRPIEAVRARDVAWDGVAACERVQRSLDHAWPKPPDDLHLLRADAIRALLAFKAMDNVPGQVRARTQLARVLLAQDDVAGCYAQIERARSLLAGLGDPAILRLQAGLDWVHGEADLNGQAGKAEPASQVLARAEQAYQSTGEAWHLACVRVRLAQAGRMLHPPGPAVQHVLHAALTFDACGDAARYAYCVELLRAWC
ncbi:hypothetical protein OIE66_12935 [Nonomuraea sp. NBC_01738]|uniref:hypothetical protein n=1 Tax=Nonomuraea sp. NBC_01738 TaxID=2976003 RepID=UPI002E0FF5D4|nr:hypothetical protein OIE66_12935 [Nonomuraea sp. NBC_01738]